MEQTYSSWLTRRVAALALLLATAGAAHAQTTTFTATNGPQSYPVPVGVTSIRVVATGAGGGGGFGDESSGALGAVVRATLTVTPGEMLTVQVGGRGVTAPFGAYVAGGYNGGGTGNSSGGGGGATDLRRVLSAGSTGDYLPTRNALLVAGGGGGGGNYRRGAPTDGAGGTPSPGRDGSAGTDNFRPGRGATQTGPGAAGGNGSPGDANGNGGYGSLGGGGGGGYYGGGGAGYINGQASGLYAGGGGGGSSFVTATGSSAISYDLASAPANGLLAITPAPALTSLNPTSGPVGFSITLTGAFLTGATGVSFNGTAATTFAVVNSTTITATVPTGATSGNVTVTTPGGTSGGVAFTVAPTLTSISPNPTSVGQRVTLTGTNLSGATGVSFNGTAATTLAVVNSTTITATVPTGATSGGVTVTTPGGTSGGVAFTVVSAPTVTTATPSSITTTSAMLGGNVTATGGANVLDRGVVYSSTNTMPTIGGAGVSKFASGSTGAGDYSLPVGDLSPGTTYYVRAYATNSVSTSYGSASSFTTLVAPTLTSISPNPASVGQRVTLTGTNLSGATGVSFNGTAATTFAVVNSTTVTATVPTGATSGGVIVLTPGGTGIIALTVTSAPTVATATPSSITTTSAVLGGDVSSTGSGATVTERGVVYSSTNAAPTIGGAGVSQVASGSAGTGSYSLPITGLTPNTTYTVRAYASSSAGTTYGPAVSFTTLVAPTLTSISPNPASVGQRVTLTGTNLSGATGVSFNGTAATTLAVVNSTTITATVPTGAATGPVTVTTPGGTSNAVVLTVTQPATTVTSINRVGSSPTNAANVSFTVSFAAAVTGVSSSNFALATTGSVAGASITGVSGAGTTYTVAVSTGTGDGTLGLNLTNATGLSPGVSNVPFAGQVYTIDKTAPTVTITSPTAPNGGYTIAKPLTFVITFSEAVTDYTPNDVGATLTNFDYFFFDSTDPTTYTLRVAPPPYGPVTLTLPANVATDAAGNGNVAAVPPTYTIYYNVPTAAPVLTSPANNSTLASGRPTYAGTAPAGSTVTLYLASGGGAAQAIGTTTATGGNFSFTPSTALADGTYAVYATALASGQRVSAERNTNTFAVDATPPTATLSTTAGSPTSTLPIPFTVTFSEPVTGLSAGSFTVSNGTVTSGPTSSGANAFTFDVTPAGSGTVSVSLAANAVRDAVGNGNTASNTLSVSYAAPVTLTTWTGTMSTDWFTAGNWSAGVPTPTVDAIIAAGTPFAPLITAGTAEAQNLTLNSGATLSQGGGTLRLTGNLANNGTLAATGGTVATTGSAPQTLGGSSPLPFWSLNIGAASASLGTSASFQRALTLTGNLATNGQPLTLLSRVSGGAATDGLVVNNGGVVVGTATVQRAIDPGVNPGPGYRHYSAPVSNSTVADLATSRFAPTVNPAYNTSPTPAAVSPFPTVFGYDDSRLSLSNNLTSFDKGYFSPSAPSDALAVGRGYTVNLAATELVDFQGTLNNGPLTLPLTSTRADYPDGGWQFLGNPYPAPLDYSRVAAADRIGLESAVYVYSSTSQYAGRYRAYINGIGNPVLPIGQGFFARVASNQTSATITFRNSQRLTTPNGTTVQRTTADPRPLVQLTLQGQGGALADEAYVYFESGATSGFEPEFDAEKLPNPTGLNLSTNLASGQPLSIDGQPALNAAQRVVPLAVGVPAPGIYTFTASQLLNLSAVPVYLRDEQLGTLTDLRQQPTYQFTVSSATALNTTRFALVFSPQQALATVPAALAQQVALYPNPVKANAQLTLVLPTALGRQPVTAALLDALGRVVHQQVLPAGLASHSLPLAELASGVYSLRLSTPAGVVVKKLVIE